MAQARTRAVRTLKAQPAPAGIFESSYDPRVAAAICQRLGGGESLRSICRADPTMPTEKTVWNWTWAHPDFAAAKADAQAVARAMSLAAQRARDAERRAVRAAARIAPGRTGRPNGYSEAIAAVICARLMEGEGLKVICRDPAMPSVGTVYNWMRRRPGFVAEVRLARLVAGDVLVGEAQDSAVWLGTEAASQRAFDQAMRGALRRASQISGKRYG